jgi:hypothetical protein
MASLDILVRAARAHNEAGTKRREFLQNAVLAKVYVIGVREECSEVSTICAAPNHGHCITSDVLNHVGISALVALTPLQSSNACFETRSERCIHASASAGTVFDLVLSTWYSSDYGTVQRKALGRFTLMHVPQPAFIGAVLKPL